MSNKAKLVVFLLGLTAILLLILWLPSSSEPAPALPSPNGYDDLIEAARLLPIQRAAADYSTNLSALRGIVASNRTALQMARRGLDRNCRVTVQESLEYMEAHLEEINGLRRVALAFKAEGQLAEAEGEASTAARSYLDGTRVGLKGLAGGLIITRLVAIRCSDIGLSSLTKISDQLHSQECRKVAAELENLLEQIEPLEDTVAADLRWQRESMNLLERLAVNTRYRKASVNAQANFAQKVSAQRVSTTAAMIQFAARAYELEKKEKPRAIEQLAPEFLKAIPVDPATGTNWNRSMF